MLSLSEIGNLTLDAEKNNAHGLYVQQSWCDGPEYYGTVRQK